MIEAENLHLEIPTIILIGVGVAVAVIVLSQFILSLKKYFTTIKNVAPLLEEITDHGFTRLVPTAYKSLNVLIESINRLAARLTHENDELLFQKMQLEKILNSMKESVVAINGRGEILQLNVAAKKMFGLSAEHKNRVFSEVVRIDKLSAFSESLIHQTAPQELVIELQYQKTIDAPIAYWRVCGSTLQNKLKKIVGATLVIEDVTHFRKIENAQRDFVANVSHEIRTPLTVIKSACESLCDGGIENRDFAIKCIDSMHRHTDRLAFLVDDILALSKIENNLNYNALEKEMISVSNLCEQVCLMAREPALKKQMNLIIECNQALSFLLHEAFMQQALLNLVLNAIKYSLPNKQITITAQIIENDLLQLTVSDQGYGIATEHLSRVFERFYRVDKARSRQEGGTGLGLAIVKHIVELHGGKIKLTSQIGSGSEFIITIPRMKEKLIFNERLFLS